MLSTRATLFAPVVTWRVEGDHLVHEGKAGATPDRLPIRELHEVRLWRTIGVSVNGSSLGATLAARLRLAGRWWKMSAHHVEGPFQPAERNEDLLAVLRLAVTRRQAMGDGLLCRSGSGWQMIGAILLGTLVLATVALFAVGLVLKGIPPSPPWGKLFSLVCALVMMAALAFYLARSGRRKTMSVAQFLTYDGERSFQFGEQ
jgi:hypothetical protein